MISSDRSVFSLRELSSDLKNKFSFLKLGIIFKNLVEGKGFLSKRLHKHYIFMKIVFFFSFLRFTIFLWFRSETRILKE